MDVTPSGIMHDEDNIEALPESDDETDGPGSNKRGLSDSYLALKEKSPSVPQMKRRSSEHLPRVPGCLDSSYYESMPLIGDNSREYLLPYDSTCSSEHSDFKCVSHQTVADLINGKFDGVIDNYLIFDNRYPYEYEGGHIKGAINIVTQEQMTDSYFSNPTFQTARQVVIFHCEFSSKRGPKMCRYVRKTDRTMNKQNYPKLFYPEIYILHGGYKDFYPKFPGLCVPQNYTLMLDPLFETELAHWLKVTKQATGDNLAATVRGMKKRTKSSRQLQLPE